MNVLNPGKVDRNKFLFYQQNQITDVFFLIAWLLISINPEVIIDLSTELNFGTICILYKDLGLQMVRLIWTN